MTASPFAGQSKLGRRMMVEVTQADREATADVLDEVCSFTDHNGIGQVADLIRDGDYDEHPCVQRIAAHRIAERERCAWVNYDALKAQMEAQADDTTPSSIHRGKGLVWLEGWFDLSAAQAIRSGE